MNKTLIIIDVQNDFLPGGSLAVPHSESVIGRINAIQPQFNLVVASQDWHPVDHISFAANHADKKPFDTIEHHGHQQTLWPIHCVQGTHGADFHAELNTYNIAAIFRKGMATKVDSYSCFYDNDHKTSTGMRGYFQDKGVKTLYFCGLAADVCVAYSINDALQAGFECYLIEDATQAIDASKWGALKKAWRQKGVKFLTSETLQ